MVYHSEISDYNRASQDMMTTTNFKIQQEDTTTTTTTTMMNGNDTKQKVKLPSFSAFVEGLKSISIASDMYSNTNQGQLQQTAVALNSIHQDNSLSDSEMISSHVDEDRSIAEEDEEEIDTEELIMDYKKENSPLRLSSSPPNSSSQVEAKKRRIMRRCAEVFDNIKISGEDRNKVTTLMEKQVNGISDIKLKKKSHRALAVGIAVLALKEVGIELDVKETSKMIPRTDRHHKSNNITKTSEKSEAICISRLACSISNENKRRDELDHSKGTLLATEELIKKLRINPEDAAKARYYTSFSENTSLASRHAQSIAAAAVCLATNMRVSVSEVVKASQISATTVRKTISALKPLVI